MAARAEPAQALVGRALVLASSRCRAGSPAACRGSSWSARTRSSDIHTDMGVQLDRMRLVPVGVDPELFRPLPGRRRACRPADHHRVGRRRPQGPRLPARGDRQAAHRARRHAHGHRQAQAGQEHRPDRAARPGAVHRLRVRRGRRARSSSSTPRPSWPSCRASTRGSACRRSRRWAPARALVATDGGALPEVTGRDGETVLSCRSRRRRRAGGDDRARARRSRAAAPRSARPAAQRVLERWTWRRCAELTVEQYREVLAMPPNVEKLRRNGRLRDADPPCSRSASTGSRLGLTPASRVLDVGAGFGRHAFERARRGAPGGRPRLRRRRGRRHARHARRRWSTAGEIRRRPAARRAARRRHAAAVRRRHVRRGDHVRGARAHPGRRRRRSPRWSRVLRAGRRVRRHGAGWLPGEDQLDALRRVPRAQGGRAATCGSTRATELQGQAASRRAASSHGSHHAHALHSPYWWLQCAVGVNDDDHPLVRRVPQVPRVGHRASAAQRHASPSRLLSPVLGKSLVLYATKPATTVAECRMATPSEQAA